MKRNSVAFRKAEELARQAGFRLTAKRHNLLAVLINQRRPQMTDALVNPQTGHRVTVYRNLEALEAAGLVQRTRFRGEDADRFELSDRLTRHHHHVVRQSCGKTAEIAGCESWFGKLRVPGFSKIRHQLEFSGLCKGCSRP